MPVALPDQVYDMVSPLPEGPPGFVRPYLPWPSLADVGLGDMALLEAPVRAMLDRLEAIGRQPSGASSLGRVWAGHVVSPDTVLRELARWRTGQSDPGPNRLTGHHFLVYAPIAAMTGDVPAQVVLLPTQWRLLHREWRQAFVVHDEPESPGTGMEDAWAG